MCGMSTPDLPQGLEDLTGLIRFRVAVWNELGYENPPSPDCNPVPPLGRRSAEAIKAGYEAIKEIDDLIAQARALRAQLARELRQDDEIRAARLASGDGAR
jgi:hypothetical protein